MIFSSVLFGDAALVELHRRDAQALLEDLGRVGSIRPRHTPADIAVVGDDHGEAEQPLPGKDRLEHEDVGQVHAAVIGVVEHDHVAGKHVIAEAFDDHVHRIGHRTEVQRDGLGLAEDAPLGVADRHGIIEHVAHDRRARRAHDGIGHVVDDGVEPRLDDGEGDGVDGAHEAGLQRRDKTAGRVGLDPRSRRNDDGRVRALDDHRSGEHTPPPPPAA